MDPSMAPIYPHIKEFLPTHRCATSSEVPLFLTSIRYIERDVAGFLLCRALRLDNKETIDLIVDNLCFYLAVPRRHLQIVNDHLTDKDVRKSFSVNLFNGDKKKKDTFQLFVFSNRAHQQMVTTSVNRALFKFKESTYTFGDHDHTYDGNTVAVSNNILCSHLYHVDEKLLAGQCKIPVGALVYDNAAHEKVLVHFSDISAWVRREGAFDIETVVHDSNLGEDTNCERFVKHYFADYNESLRRYGELKSAFPTLPIDKPPEDAIVMKQHRIISVSLVVANYHLTKSPGARRHRKLLYVFYDGSYPRAPLDLEPYKKRARQLGIDLDRVEFVNAPSEYVMLKSFLCALLRGVDMLYVYHANFDVAILNQRLAYYRYESRSSAGCCPAHDRYSPEHGQLLQTLWNNFLSKQPTLYKGTIVLGSEQLRCNYARFVTSIAQLMSNGKPLCARLEEARARQTKYLIDKSKVQNLKSMCYGSELVDLHLVVKQKRYNECCNGKLDSKAKLIIGMHKPRKNVNKISKLGDVSYDKLDDCYMAGGARLAECLVYNLIDSQLLLRIAKCINPLQEYVFRQVSTLNVDQMIHTRGQMQFSGFIAPTKSVDISKFKAKLDLGLVLSTAPTIRNHLYVSETIPKRGGYVLNPLTGLSFSSPRSAFECIVDFASLYPSIMCDLNISSETIVDHGAETATADYLCYDWQTIDQGFNKYTLVMVLERTASGAPVALARHTSDTSASLRRYLALRKLHKEITRHAADCATKDYHDRLQNEMKICANSHYGTADQTCSLMITTQGQHKIKLVNDRLYKYNMFPNYGDTDSTMFWSPPHPETEKLFDADEMSAFVRNRLSERLIQYISTRVQKTQGFIDMFLNELVDVLLDDMMSKMIFHVNCPTRGLLSSKPHKVAAAPGRLAAWHLTDPLTNDTVNVSKPFLEDMITKLEYETCSSITCHVAKKMYICLTHDIGKDAVLKATSIKRRGMTGFKTSRFGATETITNDFIDLIFKGRALVKTSRGIDRYKVTPWESLQIGDDVMLMPPDKTIADPDPLQCHKVTRVQTEDVRSTTRLVFVEFESTSGAPASRTILLQNNCSITHLYSPLDPVERELAFVTLAQHRTFSIAMGIMPWSHMIRYAKTTAFKPEYLNKRKGYGLLSGKDLKLPYVKLIDKKLHLYSVLKVNPKLLTFPNEWVKQDPAVAFMRRFPINLNLETLMKDYFGPTFKCQMSNFEPAFPAADSLHTKLHIKSFIDTYFFNTGSKCLAHVLVDLHFGNTADLTANTVDFKESILRLVNKVTTTKECFLSLMHKGQAVFYSIHRTVPGELLTTSSPTANPYTYCPDRDLALTPLDKDILHIVGGLDYAAVLYDSAISNLKTCIETTRANDTCTFVPLSDRFTNNTLTVLPPAIARDLAVFPQIVLRGNDTQDAALLRMAQMLYYATLAKHALTGKSFETHPAHLDIHVLHRLPFKITADDLKTYFVSLAKYISRHSVDAHCCNCLNFWIRQNPKTIVADNYTFDGQFFTLKMSTPCVNGE